jgi:N-acetylmuramoyl-L-alanine amidase
MKNVLSKLLICAVIAIATPSVAAHGADVYIESEQDIAEEIYYDSLEYLACCVEAEAGNQGLMGKRLVCDVILNRVDSKDFPDNIFDVINQKNQFSVVSNGRIYEVSISDETFEACRLELEKRTDAEILYFTAGGYSACGSPAYKYKEHYFSK